MRLSTQLFKTLREEPSDAEVRSHALMARASFVVKLAAGIYVYAPMMHRVLRRVEAIVRAEHDAAGCQELLMPAMQPRELWEESGRWDRYTSEGILFHFADRKGAEVCLGPTHEEVITHVARKWIHSYKQLPSILYQIQTKFRDEIRPRFGLMRGREFIMKDAYSFDADAEGMGRSYQVMREVYMNVFTRCGLRFTPVQADSGAIGGAMSEEFMVDAETGEDAIAVCRDTGYAANLEKATSRIAPPAEPEVPNDGDARIAMHKESTPDARTCDALQALFPDLPLTRMLKTILYKVTLEDGEHPVAVMCRGDREVNEVKLAGHLAALNVELADEALVKRVTGAEVGFAGPIGLAADVRMLADQSVEGVKGFLCGGNETDTHYLDVWFGRDLDQPETFDFGVVQEGDAVLEGEGQIALVRGIEVGHIFQLGTKYAEAMDARYSDEAGKLQVLWMGCYGIGVSRVAASAIEQNHDEKGMIWPLSIAPHQVLIVQMKVGNDDQDRVAGRIHDTLTDSGVDVLWDDRKKESPGAKFKDADLIGIPLRIVVGRDAAEGNVEWSPRSGGEREIVSIEEACDRVRAAVSEARVPSLG